MACINGILLVLLGIFYIRKKINVLREKLTLILRYNSVVKDHRKILLYFFSFFYSFLNDPFLEYIFSVYYFKRISVFFFIICNIILRDREAREIREWKISGSFRIKFSRDTFLPYRFPSFFPTGKLIRCTYLETSSKYDG